LDLSLGIFAQFLVSKTGVMAKKKSKSKDEKEEKGKEEEKSRDELEMDAMEKEMKEEEKIMDKKAEKIQANEMKKPKGGANADPQSVGMDQLMDVFGVKPGPEDQKQPSPAPVSSVMSALEGKNIGGVSLTGISAYKSTSLVTIYTGSVPSDTMVAMTLSSKYDMLTVWTPTYMKTRLVVTPNLKIPFSDSPDAMHADITYQQCLADYAEILRKAKTFQAVTDPDFVSHFEAANQPGKQADIGLPVISMLLDRADQALTEYTVASIQNTAQTYMTTARNLAKEDSKLASTSFRGKEVDAPYYVPDLDFDMIRWMQRMLLGSSLTASTSTNWKQLYGVFIPAEIYDRFMARMASVGYFPNSKYQTRTWDDLDNYSSSVPVVGFTEVESSRANKDYLTTVGGIIRGLLPQFMVKQDPKVAAAVMMSLAPSKVTISHQLSLTSVINQEPNLSEFVANLFLACTGVLKFELAIESCNAAYLAGLIALSLFVPSCCYESQGFLEGVLKVVSFAAGVDRSRDPSLTVQWADLYGKVNNHYKALMTFLQYDCAGVDLLNPTAAGVPVTKTFNSVPDCFGGPLMPIGVRSYKLWNYRSTQLLAVLTPFARTAQNSSAAIVGVVAAYYRSLNAQNLSAIADWMQVILDNISSCPFTHITPVRPNIQYVPVKSGNLTSFPDEFVSLSLDPSSIFTICMFVPPATEPEVKVLLPGSFNEFNLGILQAAAALKFVWNGRRGLRIRLEHSLRFSDVVEMVKSIYPALKYCHTDYSCCSAVPDNDFTPVFEKWKKIYLQLTEPYVAQYVRFGPTSLTNVFTGKGYIQGTKESASITINQKNLDRDTEQLAIALSATYQAGARTSAALELNLPIIFSIGYLDDCKNLDNVKFGPTMEAKPIRVVYIPEENKTLWSQQTKSMFVPKNVWCLTDKDISKFFIPDYDILFTLQKRSRFFKGIQKALLDARTFAAFLSPTGGADRSLVLPPESSRN
jgi:hypothetical protein